MKVEKVAVLLQVAQPIDRQTAFDSSEQHRPLVVPEIVSRTCAQYDRDFPQGALIALGKRIAVLGRVLARTVALRNANTPLMSP